MIIQLFIFAILFLVLGIIFLLKKRRILGWMFMLLSVFAFVIGLIVVSIYPHTLPF
mgnify:CR=1 FL=1